MVVLDLCKGDEKDQRTCYSPLAGWKGYKKVDMCQTKGHEWVKIELW